MGFYAILCPRPSPAPEDSSCTVIQSYFSVVSRRFYPSEMYIMSQRLLSYFRIDTLSPSSPTDKLKFHFQISQVGFLSETRIKVYFKVFCLATDGDEFAVESHRYFRSDKLVRTEVDKLVFCNIKS